MICSWCGYDYGTEFNRTIEEAHTIDCRVFQGLPTAEIRDGKEYVQHPKYENLFVERYPRRVN